MTIVSNAFNGYTCSFTIIIIKFDTSIEVSGFMGSQFLQIEAQFSLEMFANLLRIGADN